MRRRVTGNRSHTIVRLATALLLLVAVQGCSERLALGPGTFAPDPPVQGAPEDAAPLQHGEAQLQPRATYSLTAKVLSKRRYRRGNFANVAPWDFAMGWGLVSDEHWLQNTRVVQGDRFMFWHLYDSPLDLRSVERSSANMHLVPATPEIRALLDAVPTGSIVTLQGQLVDLSLANGTRIPTSLSRLDTGPGACEILYVQSVTRLR